MSSRLSDKECVPCHGGMPTLSEERVDALLRELDAGWEVVDGHHLEKSFGFSDFVAALDFVNRVGELAESEGHHPDLHLSWGRVEVEIWTHAVDGLTENDFVLAAKIEEL
jgi:4a-hydroxytetrahydrobiopterin dehydratase